MFMNESKEMFSFICLCFVANAKCLLLYNERGWAHWIVGVLILASVLISFLALWGWRFGWGLGKTIQRHQRVASNTRAEGKLLKTLIRITNSLKCILEWHADSAFHTPMNGVWGVSPPQPKPFQSDPISDNGRQHGSRLRQILNYEYSCHSNIIIA